MNDRGDASPTLDTPRLRLRDARPSDAGPLLAITAYDGAWADDANEAAGILERIRADQRSGSTLHWVACLREDGAPVGNVGFYRGLGVPGPDREAEIGYAFVPAARGKGLAGEAVQRACRYGAERLGLARVVAFAEPDNAASRRLLARLGFRAAGTRGGLLRFVLDASKAREAKAREGSHETTSGSANDAPRDAASDQDSSASGPDGSPSS